MFCRKCGAENPYNAYQCSECGEPLQQAGTPGAPAQSMPNYLVQSILVTLFCCLPFGIVAIVYAAQVNGKLIAGDVQGAMQASKSARTWCWVSFWFGLVSLAISLVYFVVVFMAVIAGNMK